MKIKLAVCALAVTLIQGCTSMAVSNDAIETNTAHALGLSVGEFTINDRRDSGIKTTYTVQAKAGKRYSCYVTGGVSVVGAVVSDALCTELAAAGSATKPAAVQCNALLSAAGKC